VDPQRRLEVIQPQSAPGIQWARVVQSLGAIPLHSTSWENSASQAVAKKLHLVPYGADLQVT
jgi:hypothetical protein